MNTRLKELVDYIDAQLMLLRSAYESVPANRRALRPSPDRWSAAEVVHHVAIVEKRVVQRLKGLVEEARALGRDQDESPLLAAIDTRKVSERTARFKTSELGEPRDTDPTTVWDELEATRRALKEVIASAEGVPLGKVTAPHPALGAVNGYEWIAFTGSHAARHADQIREDATI